MAAALMLEIDVTDETEKARPTKAEPAVLKDLSNKYTAFVASLLVKERKRIGLTQQDIADRTGMSRPWVSTVENGKNQDATASWLYAAALGIDLYGVVALAEAALWREHQLSGLGQMKG
jgi:DNA-binding XRE family transcriptional regulator